MRAIDLAEERWGAFVAASAAASPFHHPAWARLLGDCYGYPSFALVVEGPAGEIVAGLPVVEIDVPLLGRRWVSLPFTDYCEPLAVDETARASLVRSLEQARRDAGVSRIDVRAALEGPGIFPGSAGVRHVRRLGDDLDSVFRSLHRSQVQRNIERAQSGNLSLRTGTERADLCDVYFRLHSRTRRRQGVPTQPRRFFDLVWERMLEAGLGFVSLAYAEGAPVAGAVFLTWNGTVIYKYGASDERAWSLRPNHLVFWEAIAWGVANGFHTFDFGRTEAAQTGLRSFKSGWGGVEEPLIYATLADAAPKPSRMGSARMLEPLIRLSPVWVSQAVGRLLYRFAA